MEKYYEYSEDKTKCAYDLVVDWCRRCLFETFCHYQRMKNNQNKEEEL